MTAMGVLLIGVGASLGAYFTGQQQGALLGGVVALGVWLVLWLVARFQGDEVLLQMAGARQIEKRDHPQLYNVVEEMAIAAQLPKVPRVFIVDDPSPNAFAVGRDPEKAAVAVTIGLLQMMDRDQLQGVVAHEVGHVKNRDVALMTTVGIMLGAIVILADIGMRAMWFGGGVRRSRDDGGQGGGAQAVLMLVAIVMLILSPILAQLIYFALSRRREYLADASGAMYTRWPEGLASALEKLGKAAIPQSDQSKVTAPMYIVRPLRQGERRSLSASFSTHPPLEKRIQILRSMAGGADFKAYDQAYSKVTGNHVVGARTLAGAQAVSARAPAAAAEPVDPPQRLRAASNAFLAGAGYQRIPCNNCGATVKIPQVRQGRGLPCPRCGAPL